MEFLNSSVQCPLSSTAYYALTEFLRIPNAPTNEILSPSDNALSESEGDFGDFVVDTNTNKEASELQPPTKEASNTSVSKAMALSSQCISELLQAEQNQRFATDLLLVESNNTTELPLPTPMLPDHVTENLQNAMHEALMKVMAERDEAHAQLVSASVLHAHNLEQERKKVERLEAKLELANKLAAERQMAGIPRFGLDRKKLEEEEKER